MVEKKGRDGLSVGFWGSSKARLGREGEIIVSRWLIDHNYMVVPTSLINTGFAPMLEGRLERIVLPDTLAWKEGEPSWFEIKTKTTHTVRRFSPCADRWEHGLPLRLWNHYCRIQEKTKIPVSIAIVQLDLKLLLVGRLDSLKRGLHPVGNETPRLIDNEPHVFFKMFDPDTKYSDFDRFDDLSNYRLPNGIKPIAIRTLAQSNDPMIRQMTLDEFLDYARRQTLWFTLSSR